MYEILNNDWKYVLSIFLFVFYSGRFLESTTVLISMAIECGQIRSREKQKFYHFSGCFIVVQTCLSIKFWWKYICWRVEFYKWRKRQCLLWPRYKATDALEIVYLYFREEYIHPLVKIIVKIQLRSNMFRIIHATWTYFKHYRGSI